jgi:predicted glycosyltransferase involved in capsule biosynthesis
MITFISHFRGDTEYRYRNLKNVIAYYGSLYPDSEHIIINDSSEPDERLKEFVTNRTKFYFFENPSDYRRCECYNIGIRNASNEVIVFLDVDVLVAKNQIDTCVKGLMDGIVHFAYPYGGRFVDIMDHNMIPDFVINFNDTVKLYEGIIPKLELNTPHESGLKLLNDKSLGGIQISTKKFMTDIRGWNIDFWGWGVEDFEVFERIRRIGCKIGRVDGELYHMNHDSIETVRGNNPHIDKNNRLFLEMINMDVEEFQKYLNSWKF